MTHDKLLHIYYACNPNLIVSGRKASGLQIVSAHLKKDSVWVTTSNMYDHYGATLKPHLKPLSSITDEDAIAVVKIINPYYKFDSLNLFTFESEKIGLAKQEIAIQIYFSSDDAGYRTLNWILEIALDFDFFSVFSKGNDTPEIPWQRIIDYLRSNSYNLDFEEANYIKI